ncbi:DNA-directed RNA polymerase subunit omega [Aureibacillus halotolerans]|uniref:DNA-directed RNA polymerase subunit omega n=1 Tax=Aureibacillus halotolerans TaxID=1508390 RepID=A0A4R6U969_9BACI|nr:DNA-directed RNA polymerase subunit omega [Aureibacillus halotolerans]TDQ42366.1 DNA-directed RNA polymerase subunit omega [Aureibacillus halotolerans]
MLYPSIDSLMETIDSKYTLVTVSARRARQLLEEENYYIDLPKSRKNVGVALEEIQEGLLTVDYVDIVPLRGIQSQKE